jgi:NAD(P)-dependent dehydrogenase (short-subunit alcohol dehydrogenase family)
MASDDNRAGAPRPLVEVTTDEWSRVVGVNLNGTANTIRSAASRLLRDQLPGKIIVTASISGMTAEPNAATYCASKWGIVGLIKTAALELAPYGILVNGVSPGDVETDLFRDMTEGEHYHGPLGRPAQPNYVAGAYLWLASVDARWVVGEALVVDGGLSATVLVH